MRESPSPSIKKISFVSLHCLIPGLYLFFLLFGGVNDGPAFSESQFRHIAQHATPQHQIIFATLAKPYDAEEEVLLWAGSIRKFGGSLSQSPLWVFVPSTGPSLTERTKSALSKLRGTVIPVKLDERFAQFPLAAKVFAAAIAESLATDNSALLVWMDSDNIVVEEPRAFLLPAEKALGFRPVQHLRIGSPYDRPPDDFWTIIYRHCGVPQNTMFPMTTVVDQVTIRPYFNAGHIVLRPEKKILRTWRSDFQRIALHPDLLPFYRKSIYYSIFIDQAVLSGSILATLNRSEMVEFPLEYNYPLMLYTEIDENRRISRLNDLITVRYDGMFLRFFWQALLEQREPMKSWLSNQLGFRGNHILFVLNRNYGSGYYLNRDEFEKMGWTVMTAGVEDSLPPCRFLLDSLVMQFMKPDIQLPQVKNLSFFDAISILPATTFYQQDPFRELMENHPAMGFIRTAMKRQIPLSAICSSVRVLASTTLLKGKTIVGNPAFIEEYRKAGARFLSNDHPPVTDGNLITGARDQYYDYANSQALLLAAEQKLGRGHHRTKETGTYIFSAPAQIRRDSSIAWIRTIGGYGPDGARSIIATDDGGFLLTGYTFSHGTKDSDILVVKTNSQGELQWYKTLGGAGSEYGNHVLAVNNGYLITGHTTSYGAGSRDLYLVKLDRNGELQWTRTYGGKDQDVGTAACEANGGGFFVLGDTHSFGAGESDLYVLKLDITGKKIWSKTYGGERSEYSNSMSVASDGTIFIGATTGTYGGANCDFQMIKLDSNGRHLWSRAFGSTMKSAHSNSGASPFDWCTSMKQTNDGSFLLAGHSNSTDIMNIHLVKSNPQGVERWTKTFGKGSFYDFGQALAVMPDGTTIVCGTTKSIHGNNDVFVATIDPAGNILWQKSIGSSRSEMGLAVTCTTDGAIIVAGQSSMTGIGSYDMLLIKINPPVQ